MIEAAVEELEGSAYSDALLDNVLAATGYSLDEARPFFERSEDLIMALYARFAADLESRIAELSPGTLAERFEAMLRLKIEAMRPYRLALKGLTGRMQTRKKQLGVFSPETEMIRVRVRGVLNAVIEGATDNDGLGTGELVRSLYSIYLGVMWVWLRTTSDRPPDKMLKAVRGLVSFSAPHLTKGLFRLPLKFFSGAQQATFFRDDTAATEKGRELLGVLFRHRRLHRGVNDCSSSPCGECLALHLPRMAYFISTDRPIHLILPAFPAKSPNRLKTLGSMPDTAEEQALIYLAGICREMKALHPAGVRLTICSDGHVFSDLVGVTDADVTAYGDEITKMTERLGLADIIETFSLRDIYADLDLPEMRAHLNRHYELPLAELRKRAALSSQTGRMINGIHRFLFEDNIAARPDLSRTQIRNECRLLAYSVVQRSEGWSRLLGDCFPMALRLSIHPQEPHSDKIGVLLGEADDVWMTPWHSVAVRENGRYRMMKRADAEAAGARLAGGHYEL